MRSCSARRERRLVARRSPATRPGDAALDPPDLAQAADARDVGRLGRPGRDGAEARDDPQVARPASALGGARARTASSGRGARVARRSSSVAVDVDEVDELGGEGGHARVAGLQPPEPLGETGRGQGRRAGPDPCPPRQEAGRLQAGNPGVTALAADFVHFVESGATARRGGHPHPARLLQYGPRAERGAARAGLPAVGRPAPRHHLPLVAKATDIARICGLAAQGLRRIERGVVYTVAGAVQDEAALRGGAARPDDRVGAAPRRRTRRSSSRAPSRGRCGRSPCSARGARGAGPGQRRAGPGPLPRRDRLPGRRASPPCGREPHRRRADDVRAGQQRALPPQDLQRRASPSTASSSRARCSR